MFTEEQKKEVRDYLNEVEGSVYIGCDSDCFKRFNHKLMRHEEWATYAVVLAVHIENSKGCKVFHYTVDERNFDADKKKPRMRLMNEVYKSVGLYLEFADVLEDREVEIHLDVSPNACDASNAVAKQALGYVKGTTNIDAKTKPHAFAGSGLADHCCRGKPM